MSRRLETNRFKRSASSCKVVSNSSRSAAPYLSGKAAQARHGAEDRSERRAQIVRDRGQQRAAQPLGLGQHARLVEPLGERDPLDRHRRLVAQRVEQPPPVGRQQRPGRIAVDTEHADRTAAGAQWQEQALATGQCVGAASGRAVVLPGPARCRHIGGVELVLGRIARGDFEPFAVLDRQQQDGADIQHRRDLIGGRPQQIVERADRGDLAAERVELGRGLGPRPRAQDLAACPRRQIADDDRDDQKKEQREDILGIADRKGVERRQEKRNCRRAC